MGDPARDPLGHARDGGGCDDVLVHRKGATRDFAAGSEEIPADLQSVGQPVFIPGSMGTSSFVLVGEPGSMERSVRNDLPRRGAPDEQDRRAQADRRRRAAASARGAGIVVRPTSNRGLAEEAPFAYKHVERVVEIVERAGLAKRVAQLVPIGVVKG